MALSKKRLIDTRDLAFVSHPVAAGAKGFEGGILMLNAAGFALAGAEVTGQTCVGKANESFDNTGGPDGAVSVTARLDVACRYDNDAVAPVTREHIMQACYIKDDVTVSSDNTGRSAAGKVVDVDADGVWIAFL